MWTTWCLHHRWWFLWNFELYSITFDEDPKENKQFKIVNDVLFHSLQSALTSVVKHRNVNSFILHHMWWFVWLWSAYYNDERSSYSKLQYNVKDEKHLKTENASTDYCSVAYYASVCQWCQDISKQTPFSSNLVNINWWFHKYWNKRQIQFPIKICKWVWTRCSCDR